MFEVIGVLAVIAAGVLSVASVVYFVLRTIESWNVVKNCVHKDDYSWDKQVHIPNNTDFHDVRRRLNSVECDMKSVKSSVNALDDSIEETFDQFDIQLDELRERCKCSTKTK